MPIRAAIKDLVPEAQTWRREIHQNPGLMYDVEATAEFVAKRLRAFGCDESKRRSAAPAWSASSTAQKD